MKFSAMLFCFTLATTASAADSPYKLDLGASVQGGSLKVEPQVSGPAGKQLQYKMEVRREGQGKSSNSSQGGSVKLDENGHARLASNSVNVSSNDRYQVSVRLLDGGRVVAEKSEQYP
jgi:hypothetical protein